MLFLLCGRVSGERALWLAVGVAALTFLALALQRWLTLLGVGDATATARGLAAGRARLLLLALATALVAIVTAVVGPIAFIGLIAPHMALLLGAPRVRDQILLSAGLGLGLLVLSDWIGRSVFFPEQLPASTAASIIGGTYFALLLARRRLL